VGWKWVDGTLASHDSCSCLPVLRDHSSSCSSLLTGSSELELLDVPAREPYLTSVSSPIYIRLISGVAEQAAQSSTRSSNQLSQLFHLTLTIPALPDASKEDQQQARQAEKGEDVVEAAGWRGE
jgi:hypothetical protein